MPNKNFPPKFKDALERDYWLFNFMAKLEAHPTHYGMPPAEFADLKAHVKSWHAAYDWQLKTQIDLRAAEQKLTDAEQAYKDIVRAYNDAVQASPADPDYKSELQSYNDAVQSRPQGLPPLTDMPLPPAQEGEEWKQ